jgi:hypothetical protein
VRFAGASWLDASCCDRKAFALRRASSCTSSQRPMSLAKANNLGTMRRIFSGVIGDRGIEPGRAVRGGVAALPESAILDSAGQVLGNATECQTRKNRRVDSRLFAGR